MDPIKDFLEIVKLAKAQTHRNLTLFPLMAPESGDPDYLTLEEALQAEAVVITEVSESGNVPELKRVNRSESKVLILDGEELKGAKQNRIVNATFLIGPKMEVVIPVSGVCLPVAKVAEAEDPRRSRAKPYTHTASPGQRRRFGLPGFPEG